MYVVIQSFINGLLNGGIYALVAVGMTIVFGTMKMINFALGEFLTYAMYVAWISYTVLGLSTYANLPFVIIACTVIAVIVFKVCLKPLLGRDGNAIILCTVGLSYLMQNLFLLIFGSEPKSIPFALKGEALRIGDFALSYSRLIAFIVGIVLIVLVEILINKTTFGKAMKATSEKPEVAQMLGIKTTKVFTWSYVMSIILAGMAGLLLTPLYTISPTTGVTIKQTTMMIVVLGGMGSIPGALIAGILCGIVEAMVSSLVAQELGMVGIFVLFILVVYFKPQGLFGKKGRVI